MEIKQLVKKNMPLILTGVGAIGVVVTSVLAGKNAVKANKILEDNPNLTKKEKLKALAPVYAPTIVSGVATMGCIIGSGVMSKRQQASLVGAYAMVSNSFRNYRECNELPDDKGARRRITERMIGKNPPTIRPLEEEQLYYDFFTGEYFSATPSLIIAANNELNRSLNKYGEAYLSDYYEMIGMPYSVESKILGWQCHDLVKENGLSWIDFETEEIVIDEDDPEHEGLVCTIVYFADEPYCIC